MNKMNRPNRLSDFVFDPVEQANLHNELSKTCKVNMARSMATNRKPKITARQVFTAIGWLIVSAIAAFVYLEAPVVGGRK